MKLISKQILFIILSTFKKAFTIQFMLTLFILFTSVNVVQAKTDIQVKQVSDTHITKEKEENWLLLGIDKNKDIDIYFSDEKGNRISEDFKSSELNQKIKEFQKKNPRWSANAGETNSFLESGGYTVTVPIIRRSDTNAMVYCMQSSANFPAMSEYNGLGDPYHNSNIAGVFWYGATNDTIGRLAEKYGLDWAKAHYGTQVALWRVLHQQGYPSNDYEYLQLTGDENLIAFINELATKQFENVPKNFDISFSGIISQTNPQLSDIVMVNSELNYEVFVTAGTVIDINGNARNTFSAGENFKVQADGNFKSNVTVTVKTSQEYFTPIIFGAVDDGIQKVGLMDNDDPIILEKSISMEFKGAIDRILIDKYGQTTTDKKLLANTVYTLAKDKNFAVDVRDVKTDSNGHIEVSDYLYASETVYIKEKYAPVLSEYEGYNINSEVTEILGVGGKTHNLSFINERIEGKICIHKVNQNKNPLQNVAFTLLDKNGQFVDKKVTDAQGNLCFENLELGKYKIIEDLPPNHSPDQRGLVFDVDVKIDETLVQQGYNTSSNYIATINLEIVNTEVKELKPQIGTLATTEAGGKLLPVDTEVTLIDKVSYTDLSPNKEYTLKGILMDKATGKPLLIDNKEIISTQTFTPTQSSGTVDVKFTFNTIGLAGREIVVFEYLYLDETEITTHTDINDEGQTVRVANKIVAPTTLVNTGENIGILLVIGSFSLIAGLFLFILKYKDKIKAIVRKMRKK